MKVKPREKTVVALVLACLFGLPSSAAWSDTRTCRQLEAAFEDATSDFSEAARFDDAIVTQREQLQIARQQSRNAGCGFSMSGSGIARCGRINAQIERMERNLDSLQRRQVRAGAATSQRARARIAAALLAKGCSGEAVAEARAPEDSSGRLLDQVFRVTPPEAYEERPPPAEIDPFLPDEDTPEEGWTDDPEQSGIYRIPPSDGRLYDNVITIPPPVRSMEALCVRTCDGYFFPMSNGGAGDQKSCEASCPGAEVQVYYRAEPGGEGGDGLISAASGAPYSELSTAYLFKKAGTPRPANCSCNPPKSATGFKVVTGTPAVAPPVATELPPAAKTTAGSIDEIAAPEIPASAAPAATSENPSGPAEPEPGKKVRVVGPAFLPDPSKAIDLQAPARNPVR